MTNMEKLHLLRLHRIGYKRPLHIPPSHYKTYLNDAKRLEVMVDALELKKTRGKGVYKNKRIKYDITIHDINIKGGTNSIQMLRKEIRKCDTLLKQNKVQLNGKTTQ